MYQGRNGTPWLEKEIPAFPDRQSEFANPQSSDSVFRFRGSLPNLYRMLLSLKSSSSVKLIWST